MRIAHVLTMAIASVVFSSHGMAQTAPAEPDQTVQQEAIEQMQPAAVQSRAERPQLSAQAVFTIRERADSPQAAEAQPVITQQQPTEVPRLVNPRLFESKSKSMRQQLADRRAATIDRRRLQEARAVGLDFNREALRGRLRRLGWGDYTDPVVDEPFRIPVAQDEVVEIQDERLVETGTDGAVVHGTTDCGDQESLIFVSGDEVVGGEIYTKGRHYEVRRNPDGASQGEEPYTVTEVGEWVFVDEGPTHPVDETPKQRKSKGFWGPLLGKFGIVLKGADPNDATGVESERDESGNGSGTPLGQESDGGPGDAGPDGASNDTSGLTQIDVMVLYTKNLTPLVPNKAVGAEIVLAVQMANFSYKMSGINQFLNLVHMEEVDYAESGDIDRDLESLVTGDNGLELVPGLWRNHKADIVSLWVSGADYAGAGFTMKNVDEDFAPCAANVVEWPAAIKNYSFMHELGHNMGARHDLQQTSGNQPYPYAHGYVEGFLVSIMAYAQASCPGLSCKRMMNFSNPVETFGDRATADNARTLNKTAATVAVFDTRHNLLGECEIGD